MRDHPAEFRQIIMEHAPDPLDENAEQAPLDPGYAEGINANDLEKEPLMPPIREEQYLKS